MKLSFTKEESDLIARMVCFGETINHQLFDTKLYQAKDMPGAKQVRALQQWAETKLTIKKDKEIEFQAFEGGLKQVYVDRLKEILEHYQKIGFSTAFCKNYVTVMAKLKGETITEDSCEEL